MLNFKYNAHFYLDPFQQCNSGQNLYILGIIGIT